MKRKIILIALATLMILPATAAKRKFQYRIKAGFNLGGTSPIPLVREIRKVKGYSPSLSLSLGGEILRHISDSRWAIMSGITFETKGMTTKAQVKNYYIDMNISEGSTTGQINGVFTGNVKTKARNEYLTIPLLAVYQVSPRWSINAGLFFSVLINGNFYGSAYNGVVRDVDPTGDRIAVTSASYDFSSKIKPFNWGGQFGARWRAYRQFSVYGDLTMGANSIFKSDFTGISFDMYNLYLNIGFAYTF